MTRRIPTRTAGAVALAAAVGLTLVVTHYPASASSGGASGVSCGTGP